MRNFLSVLLFLISFLAAAQTVEEKKSILEPVTRLFTGMNLGDSAMVHSAFAKSVSMGTVFIDKSGNPAIRNESSIDGFLKAVGTPHTEKWSEPIWDTEVRMDGNLAQVWTKYAFYLGKNFSHCGVDAFQLFKGTDGKWRIFSLADTRQKEGCVIPKKISSQFK
jgi:hypothetical protein